MLIGFEVGAEVAAPMHRKKSIIRAFAVRGGWVSQLPVGQSNMQCFWQMRREQSVSRVGNPETKNFGRLAQASKLWQSPVRRSLGWLSLK